MAKTTQTPKLGELMTIRDILMGEIIEEYNGRFEEVEKKIAAQQASLNEKETSLNKRIDDLNSTLEASNSKLTKALADNSIEDKALIGELLMKIGSELNSLKS